MRRALLCGVVVAVGIAAVGCAPSGSDAQPPVTAPSNSVIETVAPSASSAPTDAAGDTVEQSDSWIGMYRGTSGWGIFEYSPVTGTVDYSSFGPESDIDKTPLDVSPNRQWVIFGSDKAEVLVSKIDRSARMTYSMSMIPLKSPDWYVTDTRFDGLSGARFGGTSGAELMVVARSRTTPDVQVWGLDVESENPTPRLVAEFSDDGSQMFNFVTGEPSTKEQVYAEFRNDTRNEDFYSHVSLPDGAQIWLDASGGEGSTVLRTWYRSSESAEWEAVGKPGDLGASGDVTVLAYPAPEMLPK